MKKRILTLIPLLAVLGVSACTGHSDSSPSNSHHTQQSAIFPDGEKPYGMDYGFIPESREIIVYTYGSLDNAAFPISTVGAIDYIEGQKDIYGGGGLNYRTDSYSARCVLGFYSDGTGYSSPILIGLTPEAVTFRKGSAQYKPSSTYSAIKYNGNAYYFSLPSMFVDDDSMENVIYVDNPYYARNNTSYLHAAMEIIVNMDATFLGSGLNTVNHMYYASSIDEFVYYYNGHLYYRNVNPASFEVLEKKAESCGGYLAIPNDDSENNFLDNIFLTNTDGFSPNASYAVALGIFGTSNSNWRMVTPYGYVPSYTHFSTDLEYTSASLACFESVNPNTYWKVAERYSDFYGIFEFDSFDNIGCKNMIGMYGGEF